MTPTPPFPMENQPKQKEGMSIPYMDKLIDPILAKVLHETNKNHVSVGPGPVPSTYSLYNPHNYRLYFDFDKSGFKLPTDPLTPVPTTYKLINTSEICFPDYHNFRIVIKKTQIELTNKIDRWHIIDLIPSEGVRPQIISIIQDLNSQAESVLKKFILEYGGYSSLKILNSTSENKVKHEKVIDTLPERMTFRNQVAKKVYMEPNVEFSDPVNASNYMANSSLSEVAPSIDKALRAIYGGLEALSKGQDSYVKDALNPLTEQIKLHLEVQRETLAVQKDMGKTLRAMRKQTIINSRREKVRELLSQYGW